MNITPFLPGLSPVHSKPLTASQDAGNLSSNGGLIVLREAARRLGFADMIARRLADERNPMLVTHTYADMITARCMAIAAGYEDADDLDHLRRDPALMIACDRAPETGADLPSQPTISRLENTANIWALVSIAKGYIDLFCAQYRTAPAAITLDIDDTDDMVHGNQQLSMFNTHAGGYCFKPIKIFEANSGLPVLTMIRPGKRPSGEEAAKVLAFCIRRIRRNWPRVRILVRGDSHYCAPEVLDLMHKLDCDYILGLAINQALDAKAAPWREQVAQRWWPSLGKVRRFHTFTYGAGSWCQTEKVIARVEATKLGSDARFIVTNLEGRSKHLYEKVYCARGNMENLIKDIKLYTRSDKTACHRWQANQFRLFLHMGAYWLLHSLRQAAPKRSRWRRATFATIRTILIKIAVRVEELKSRIKLSFAAHLPQAHTLQLIASRLAAAPP
jgi:Transposase DDE domain group 1